MMAIFEHIERFIRRLNWQFKFNSIHWLIVQFHLANDLKAHANYYLASLLSTTYFNRYITCFWTMLNFIMWVFSIWRDICCMNEELMKKRNKHSVPFSWWLFDMWKLLYGSFFLLCSYFITATITLFNIWFQLWLF